VSLSQPFSSDDPSKYLAEKVQQAITQAPSSRPTMLATSKSSAKSPTEAHSTRSPKETAAASNNTSSKVDTQKISQLEAENKKLKQQVQDVEKKLKTDVWKTLFYT
jgi:molecular chaperone GrpE (heat shock protein)